MNRYQHHRHSLGIIWFSFFIALVLQTMPWPRQFYFIQPAWVNLLLIYWVMAVPHRINVGTGFILGLIIDLMLGSKLGIRALALSILAYLVVIKLKLFHKMVIWLQSLIVILLLLTTELIIFGIEFLVIKISFYPKIFWSSALDGMLWPWLFLLMRKICCQFTIQ